MNRLEPNRTVAFLVLSNLILRVRVLKPELKYQHRGVSFWGAKRGETPQVGRDPPAATHPTEQKNENENSRTPAGAQTNANRDNITPCGVPTPNPNADANDCFLEGDLAYTVMSESEMPCRHL